ncbi:hypothetical protein [Cohnella abietis]|uniref:Uncharacterized protein n=1 Tax=Cohnella abietis TaxID=2507935 RepID=A0A3T1D4A4_9BACL|nr:hypothetical protein [Cohnella abietis]BBI32891.1 hypothetical protein KCTCHS21_22900 [Cohnella abietis]
MTTASYERWVWIELIGFDNTRSDFGVADYLETIGVIPDGISLLLFTPDFVHAHKGMEKEQDLPIEMCSYAARPYGKLHDRQQWTNYQLRGLVKELQSKGIDMYCSFFNLFLFQNEGQEKASEWCASHPELYEMRKSGEAFPVINPLKRFKDGTYYEDRFISDLMTVMRDYNFDGYHGADGYTSPRLSLAEADYSDDMVEQFVKLSGVELPGNLLAVCDNNPLEMEKRGDWIWKNKRVEWIRFYANRWGQLWQKIMPAIHNEGKKAVLNSVWTRDPFEALYRYGVDYQLLAASGVDGFVIESVAASLSAGAGETEYGEPGSEFMAMILLIKAYVPNMKLICLNAIQDTNEQWDGINHVPTIVERDIYAFSNLYLQNREGIQRCASGFVACLGDGISRDSWDKILKRWDLGFDGVPERIIGASYVWSDEALNQALKEYPTTRNWSSHKLLTELIERGAPLHTAINVNDLSQTSGAIFVNSIHLLPDEELDSVLSYRNGPSVLIGSMTQRIAQALASFGLSIDYEPNQLFGVARDNNGAIIKAFVMEATEHPVIGEQDDLAAVNDVKSWLEPLYFSDISEDFLDECVQSLNAYAGTPKALSNEQYIRTTVLEVSPGRWRILMRNLHINYKSAHLDLGRSISKITVMTEFPGIPIFPKGSEFSLYVPGRGMVIVEVDFSVN